MTKTQKVGGVYARVIPCWLKFVDAHRDVRVAVCQLSLTSCWLPDLVVGGHVIAHNYVKHAVHSDCLIQLQRFFMPL